MKKSIYFLTVFLLMYFLLCTACGNTTENPQPTATNYQQNEGIPQQPHHEASFEEMAAFLNTVNADTFENGNFKDIIERIRTEGYIIQPYFDGEPAVLRSSNENRNVLLCPQYNNTSFPSYFMYHLSNEEFAYRIDIIYIDEQFISAAQSNGYVGVRASRDNIPLESLLQDTAIYHEKVILDGTERNVTITTYSDGSSHGDFVWDKYLIRIRGDLLTATDSYATINLDILSHLSFEKMPLNPEEAPVSPTQISTE